jgi:hypothetical protein
MTAGRLYEQGDPCPACDGTGRLPAPLEERHGGYIDGPEPAARDWLIHVSGASGLAALDDKETRLFSDRFKIREREALRDMEDGLLVEHLARLRRQVVMADEDGLDFLTALTRERFSMADTELRWRNRAGDKGADRVASEAAWRDRVQAIRENVDLALLIAHENAGARPSGRNSWKCCCPFHADQNPSLDIDVVKGVWICRGCGAGGDAFTYVEMRYGLDFSAAVRHLEARM